MRSVGRGCRSRVVGTYPNKSLLLYGRRSSRSWASRFSLSLIELDIVEGDVELSGLMPWLAVDMCNAVETRVFGAVAIG
jgi:hypothetical protein